MSLQVNGRSSNNALKPIVCCPSRAFNGSNVDGTVLLRECSTILPSMGRFLGTRSYYCRSRTDRYYLYGRALGVQGTQRLQARSNRRNWRSTRTTLYLSVDNNFGNVCKCRYNRLSLEFKMLFVRQPIRSCSSNHRK